MAFGTLQRMMNQFRSVFDSTPASGVPRNSPSAEEDTTEAAQYTPLIFLDSNYLHWARLYSDFAEQHNLHPFANGDPDAADQGLKQHLTGRTLKDYLQGRKLVTYLRRRCIDDGAEVEFSPITTLEITCGLLRGNAIRDAAGQGVTHRMWNKIDELEILERLQAGVYQDIHQHTSGVQAQFDKLGIVLHEIPSQRLQEAWSLARSILGRVYLEVGDAIVVASALLSQADQLLTGDKYVRKVVNRIHNTGGLVEPEKSYYEGAQTAIKDAVASIIGVSPDEIRTPEAPQAF